MDQSLLEVSGRFGRNVLCLPPNFSAVAYDLAVGLISKGVEVFLQCQELLTTARTSTRAMGLMICYKPRVSAR